MKKIFPIAGSIVILYLSSSFYPQSFHLLNYTESSSGLQSIALESGRTEIEMADINNDGNLDILSVGDHGNPYVNTQEHGIMIWFGDGTGNWSLFQNGNFGYGGIAIGDVNNDGKQDVGYGIHHNYSGIDLGDQILEVALGDGTGMNWTAWDDSLATQGETWGMFSTDFADVDNDGLLDIGSVSFGCCAGVHVYKNMGVGKWRQTFGFTGGNSSMDFVFGDINNDGNMDFAVAQQNGTPYFGDGTGNFILKHNNLPSPGNLGFRGISLGDVNNDGTKDLAFITSTGGINVWSWDNTTQSWDNLSANLPSSSSNYGTQLCDLDKDGFVDLIAMGTGGFTIWTGNGGTNWTYLYTYSIPSPGTYADFTVGGDADHNGFPDIIAENISGSTNRLRYFKENTPYSSLNISAVYPRGSERIKNNCIIFVDWLSAAPATPSSKVKIELSTTGNSGPWNVIADSLPNNGRYQWHVPPAINSENCFFRYTVFIPGTSQNATSITPNRFIIGNLVGVENKNIIPEEYKLYQNYPNPFNPVTKIKFQISPAGQGHALDLQLVIYDILGRKISVLVYGKAEHGSYEVEWNGSNYPSGIYYYKLTVGQAGYPTVYTEVRKMMLVK